MTNEFAWCTIIRGRAGEVCVCAGWSSECGFTMLDVESAGSGCRIEPPVHRSSNAENFSAHQSMTY